MSSLKDIREWVYLISVRLSRIGDMKYQREAWIVGNPKYFSTFEEEYCYLFDDCAFEAFLHEPSISMILSDELIGMLEGLKSSLTDFADESALNRKGLLDRNGYVDPKKVLVDVEWASIQEHASECAGKLREAIA